jgi:hypothetical protein
VGESVAVVAGLAGLVVATLVAWAVFRQRPRDRGRKGRERVTDFLAAHYRQRPARSEAGRPDEPP